MDICNKITDKVFAGIEDVRARMKRKFPVCNEEEDITAYVNLAGSI